MKTIKLIICRHGNTFHKNESPRRIGSRTDIPLVETGRQQAANLGKHLKTHDLVPTHIYSGRLKRSIETASILCENLGLSNNLVNVSDVFSELDFGDDENKLEEEVVCRIGSEKMAAWENRGIIAEGWRSSREEIIRGWVSFADNLVSNHSGATILVVTSSGVARFALSLIGTTSFKEALELDLSSVVISSEVVSSEVGNPENSVIDKNLALQKNQSLKLRTGAYGILSYHDKNPSAPSWSLNKWDIRP